jgi:copper chaperone CopZ
VGSACPVKSCEEGRYTGWKFLLLTRVTIGEKMQQKSVKIPNISCGHCVRTIENEINALENIDTVKADENSKIVSVSWNEPQSWDNIRALLEEINYPPQD